jgi:hypothetical protein
MGERPTVKSWQGLGREVLNSAEHRITVDRVFQFTSARLGTAYLEILVRRALREGWPDDLILLLKVRESDGDMSRQGRKRARAFRLHAERLIGQAASA